MYMKGHNSRHLNENLIDLQLQSVPLLRHDIWHDIVRVIAMIKAAYTSELESTKDTP